LHLAEGKVGFQDTSIFDKAGSQKDGKSDSKESASASPLCPECGSRKLYRDGRRYLADGSSVQRWLCRECAYRFSEKPPQKNLKWQINTPSTFTSERRICANRKEAKNLTQATEIKTVAGEKERLPQDAKGLITKFMAYLEREGYSQGIGYPATLKHLIKDGANLLDPENVKTVIAQQKKKNGESWKDSVKMLAAYAYDAFCKMEDIKWNMPTYRQGETTLYIHNEKDLDILISIASKRMATYLQCLKETYADPGEILRLEWIDLKDDVLSINHPVKGHLPGKYQLSPRLTAMLNALPQQDKRIFPMTYACAIDSLKKLRKRAAAKFQNPVLLTISFKSYRHWGGSMLAHVTNGNVLIIKKMLRHKSIQNTMKYIHTIEFKEEDFEETVATTPEEIRQLGKAGWTKYDEMTINGTQMHFYRKPKRFGGLKTSP
jgi:integrase